MQSFYTYINTPLGDAFLLSDGQALTGFYFVGQRYIPKGSEGSHDPQQEIFRQAVDQVLDYMEGTRQVFDFPLKFDKGTLFQKSVWESMTMVPYGETRSYRDLAQTMGLPKGPRAVGGAVARNPLSIIVPCHRIIGSNGALTGYAGGLHRKKSLLDLEQRFLKNSSRVA